MNQWSPVASLTGAVSHLSSGAPTNACTIDLENLHLVTDPQLWMSDRLNTGPNNYRVAAEISPYQHKHCG